MTVEEIKLAVDSGKDVRWESNYFSDRKLPKGCRRATYVVKFYVNQYLIVCLSNDHAIGLTHKDGITLNGDEKEFCIK